MSVHKRFYPFESLYMIVGFLAVYWLLGFFGFWEESRPSRMLWLEHRPANQMVGSPVLVRPVLARVGDSVSNLPE